MNFTNFPQSHQDHTKTTKNLHKKSPETLLHLTLQTL